MPTDRLPLNRIRHHLVRAGDSLSERVGQAILDLGDEAVPTLLAILSDPELFEAEPPEGLAPLHAAELLAQLAPPAAAGPLLALLPELDAEDALYEAVCEALHALRGHAVEPMLAAFAATRDLDVRAELGALLAHAEVRDPRILAALLELLQDDPLEGTLWLGDYGDEAALPALQELLAAQEGQDQAGQRLIVELAQAIESVGGTLDAAQAEKVAQAEEALPEPPEGIGEEELFSGFLGGIGGTRAPGDDDDETDDEDEAPTGPDATAPAGRFADGTPMPYVATARPGRNDPCWCESGKKYKKCHLAADQAG